MHWVHTLALAAERNPSGHAWGEVEPKGQADPAGQGKHADLAGSELKDPAGHAVHTLAPAPAEKEPLSHAEDVDMAD